MRARAPGSPELEAEGEGIVLGRRNLALAGALAASAPAMPAALAQEAESAPGKEVSVVPGSTPSKVQRVVVTVGNEEDLDKELKFWTDAVQMKKLKDAVGKDGLRSVVVGFGPESGGAFGLEIKLDPAVMKRKRPRLLNYEVMQPTVDALNFMQVGAKGKVIEIFGRVQNSGGSSLIGDASYMDAESPRGVPVRLIPRPGSEPSVELVSFNIEVPAFEATTKFYQRSFGFKRLKYSDSEPAVQKLSVYLGSDLGGPNILLSPVPDGRLKERALDEYEGLLLTTPSAEGITQAATDAVDLANKEQAEKLAKVQEKIRRLAEAGKETAKYKKILEATRASPSIKMVDKSPMIDDGLGNIVMVASQGDFAGMAA